MIKKIGIVVGLLTLIGIGALSMAFFSESQERLFIVKGESYIDNPAFRNYVTAKVQQRESTFQIGMKDLKKENFKETFDLISSFILDETGSDIFSVDMKADYRKQTAKLTIELKYRMDEVQEKQVEQWVKTTMDPFLAGYPSEKEVVKFINDTIAAQVEYDQTLEKRSAYDAVFSGQAVCEGYAMLGKMMLTYAGVENKTLVGKSKEENHIWNLVKLDGRWYHVDFTWNDPVFINGNKEKNYVDYNYFLLTDEEMKPTHDWDETLHKGP